MFIQNICKFNSLLLVFFSFCIILYPSTCFIFSSKGFIISKAHIYRFSCNINTLTHSKNELKLYSNKPTNLHSPNENDQTYSKISQNVDNPSHLDEYNENKLESPDSRPKVISPKSGKNDNKLDYDKFEFDPETYKKIIDSFTLYKGPSYSLSEYNRELPEGCRTIVDFLEYPRNYDFSKSAEISSQGTISGFQGSLDDQSDEVQEKRMEGPYLKSSYEKIGNFAESVEKRYTTRKDEEPDVEPEEMYNILKDTKEFDDLNKSYKGNYEPFEHFSDLESDSELDNGNVYYNGLDDMDNLHSDLRGEDVEPTETESGTRWACVKRKDDIPLSRINPNYFMFDSYGYLQYYLKYINEYKYDLFSYHNKNVEKPSFYLNYEYIKKIEKPFPPNIDHTHKVREYFLSLLPTLMDRLVESIKNDPNKYNTPSPPMHDLSLLFNFKPPKYLFEDEDDSLVEKDEKYYEKYASLKGLHEPANNLIYPYHNTEPILLRQLLSTYLEIYNTKELGPVPTYRKYKSKSKYLRTATFPTHTRPPQPISGFNEGNSSSDKIEGKNLKTINNVVGEEENVLGKGIDEVNDESSVNSNIDSNSEEDYLKKYSNFQTYEVRTKLYERGKKKRGQALVYLEPGKGNIIINNRDGYQYVFYNEFRLREIMEPLSSLRLNTHFNIIAKTYGGGISGQSVAIRHALVRYLYRILSPKLKPILRRFNLVSIDRRRAERKKTNLRKARKKEMYSKR